MYSNRVPRAVRRAAATLSLVLSPILTVAVATALAASTRLSVTNAGRGASARERVSDLGGRLKEAVFREGRKEEDADEIRRTNRSFMDEVEAWQIGDHEDVVASMDDEQRREYFAPVLAMLAEDADLDDEKYTPQPAIGLAVDVERSSQRKSGK